MICVVFCVVRLLFRVCVCVVFFEHSIEKEENFSVGVLS